MTSSTRSLQRTAWTHRFRPPLNRASRNSRCRPRKRTDSWTRSKICWIRRLIKNIRTKICSFCNGSRGKSSRLWRMSWSKMRCRAIWLQTALSLFWVRASLSPLYRMPSRHLTWSKKSNRVAVTPRSSPETRWRHNLARSSHFSMWALGISTKMTKTRVTKRNRARRKNQITSPRFSRP